MTRTVRLLKRQSLYFPETEAVSILSLLRYLLRKVASLTSNALYLIGTDESFISTVYMNVSGTVNLLTRESLLFPGQEATC